VQVEQRRAVRPRLLHHLVDAAEALGDQQAGAHALLLEQRVGAHRRAVAEVGHPLGVGAGEQVLDALHDRDRRVVRRRQPLGDRQLAGVLPQEDEVGEGPAGVDGYPVLRHRSAPIS
jgi:hypothetical protein